MPDTLLIQLLALILFAVCLFHSWRTEGPRAAQQWFIIGYIYALLLTSLLVILSQIAFDSSMLVFGAAPSLTVMLFPALFYIAYTIAREFADPTDLRRMAYLVFLLTAALMMPFDAVGVELRWWEYPTESYAVLNGLPFYLPFAWGVTGAAFFLTIGRIRKIRFRGSGQLFAMIIAIPLVAAAMLVVISLIQLVVSWVASLGEVVAYGLLGLVFIVLPISLLFNYPRRSQRPLITDK